VQLRFAIFLFLFFLARVVVRAALNLLRLLRAEQPMWPAAAGYDG
jgi:hypothetical protein